MHSPKALLSLASAGALLALSATAPALAEPTNRSLESVNQPVVQRTDYVFDLTPNGTGGLSEGEQARLLDWFDAIGLDYGDRVAVTDGGYGSGAVSDDVARLVKRYGLLLSDRAPLSAGVSISGGTRVVVSRASATVPGCPDWQGRYEGDFQGGATFNYGCATNGNLAAMIADPEDLIQGRGSRTDLRTARSNRAIAAFNKAAPTGGGGNALAAGGQ